ncbi:bacillithiol system redox-active protein YtxJ [Niallia sp. MER TA 168]|jgi:bacillithiol system protein YtxJ|uniref:bacillithiol system redox-active protein YtxJ n=1 Tax=Niallia sp. MER TA 168 TaxID=2939568 RepID=UPI0020412DBE|nr:bacillithiol system redox-active protein YtxJ [Niallia sp. MER TA 168]MCM3362826.1 bacillithiol system redox-active protein YtxJ [Niallia sp. MER TA 168]
MKKIDTVEKFEDLVQSKEIFWLVKHSLTCPISANAFDEYKQYAEDNKEIATYYLAVQESRELSNYIAENYQVRHESPQALLFENNHIVWHTSHGKITVDSLQKAVTER